MTLPWQGTTPEISAEVDSRYETPGGAQNKVNVSKEYLLHLLQLAVTGLSDGSEAAIARYSDPYDVTYDWLKDRLDAADTRAIEMNEKLGETTKVINIKSYGAIGGGADDTIAINSAISAAASTGIRVVYVPAGTFKTTDTLLFSENLITFRGEGEQSVIEGYTTGKDMIKVTAAYKVRIENLFLKNLSTSPSKTVNFSAGEAHRLDTCSIQNLAGNTADIVYYQGANTKITNNGITNNEPNAHCLHVYADTTQLNINTDIIGNYFGGVGVGLLIDTVDNLRRPEGIKILHNTFLLTGTEQITIKSAYYVDISHNIIDMATNFNIKIAAEKAGVSGVAIDNNYFGNTAAFGRAIGIETTAVGVIDVTVSNNYFSSCGYAVFGSANVSGITIDGNKFAGVLQTSITLDGAKDVIITNNRESSTSFSLFLTDGADGGSFMISDNKFIGSMSITKTTPSKFKFTNNVGLADTYAVTAISGENKIQSGSSGATVTTSGTFATISIPFPVPFTTIPKVICGLTTLSVGNAGYSTIHAHAVDVNGVTFLVNSYVAQTLGFNWMAIGN